MQALGITQPSAAEPVARNDGGPPITSVPYTCTACNVARAITAFSKLDGTTVRLCYGCHPKDEHDNFLCLRGCQSPHCSECYTCPCSGDLIAICGGCKLPFCDTPCNRRGTRAAPLQPASQPLRRPTHPAYLAQVTAVRMGTKCIKSTMNVVGVATFSITLASIATHP